MTHRLRTTGLYTNAVMYESGKRGILAVLVALVEVFLAKENPRYV